MECQNQKRSILVDRSGLTKKTRLNSKTPARGGGRDEIQTSRAEWENGSLKEATSDCLTRRTNRGGQKLTTPSEGPSSPEGKGETSPTAEEY